MAIQSFLSPEKLAQVQERYLEVFTTVDEIPNTYLQRAGGALTGDVTTSNTTFVDASLVPKSYVDEHDIPYWEGTREEYEALTEPLPEGTYVLLRDESINYNELDNLPKINNIELTGNKSASDLGLASADGYIPNAGNSKSGNLSITRAGNISLDAELGNFTIGGRTVRLAADSSVVLESDGATITLDGANATIETYDGAFTVTTDEDTVMVKASEIADTEENIITWDYALFNQDAVAVLRPAFDASNDTLADIVDVWDEIIEHNLKSQLIYENLTINIDEDAIFAERTYDADCCDTIFKNCYWLFDGEVTPAITVDLQDGNYIFDNVNFSCESAVTLRIRGGATAAFKNCTFRNVNVIAMADAIVSIDSCKSDGSIKLESDSISVNRVIKQLTNTTTAQLIINIDVNTTGTCKEMLVYNNRWTTFSNIGTGTIDSSLIYSNNLDAIIGDINSILEEVL